MCIQGSDIWGEKPGSVGSILDCWTIMGNFWLGSCETIGRLIGSLQDYRLLSNPSLAGPDWDYQAYQQFPIGPLWDYRKLPSLLLSLLISSSWSGHSSTSTGCSEFIGGFGMGYSTWATTRYWQFFHLLWAHFSQPWMYILAVDIYIYILGFANT
jgi:hypothetical protein